MVAVETDTIDLFYRFGAALLIGLLVGLQREYAHLQQKQEENSFGGTRTFALLGLLGCTAAFLAEQMDSALAFVAIVTIVGGLIMISYVSTAREGSIGIGALRKVIMPGLLATLATAIGVAFIL